MIEMSTVQFIALFFLIAGVGFLLAIGIDEIRVKINKILENKQ